MGLIRIVKATSQNRHGPPLLWDLSRSLISCRLSKLKADNEFKEKPLRLGIDEGLCRFVLTFCLLGRAALTSFRFRANKYSCEPCLKLLELLFLEANIFLWLDSLSESIEVEQLVNAAFRSCFIWIEFWFLRKFISFSLKYWLGSCSFISIISLVASLLSHAFVLAFCCFIRLRIVAVITLRNEFFAQDRLVSK